MLIGGGLQGLVCIWLACGLFYRAAKADYSVDPLTLSMPFTFVVADLSMASTTFLLPIESMENPLPWSVLAAGLSSGRCIAEIPVVDYNFSPLFSNQIHRPFGNSKPVRSLGRSILHQSALANYSSIRLHSTSTDQTVAQTSRVSTTNYFLPVRPERHSAVPILPPLPLSEIWFGCWPIYVLSSTH